jgi:hypothetical protein
MSKKLYDITLTVAMSEKQYKRLCDADDRALERDENLPLWEAGLDMRDFLLVFYGVKAKLKRWRFGRNADDLRRRSAADDCGTCRQ